MSVDDLAEKEQQEEAASNQIPDNGQLFVKKELNEEHKSEEDTEFTPLPFDAEDVKERMGEDKAVVSLSAGGTKNLGNYENVKFQVGISMPCDPDRTDEVFENVKKDVRSKLNQLLSEVKEDRK